MLLCLFIKKFFRFFIIVNIYIIRVLSHFILNFFLDFFLGIRRFIFNILTSRWIFRIIFLKGVLLLWILTDVVKWLNWLKLFYIPFTFILRTIDSDITNFNICQLNPTLGPPHLNIISLFNFGRFPFNWFTKYFFLHKEDYKLKKYYRKLKF